MKKRHHIIGVTFLVIWILSWIFARDIIKGLEAAGIIPKRGLVLTDASDFMFSMVVIGILFSGWAVWRMVAALGGRSEPLTLGPAEDDPRYRELLRQKEQLLRDLKDLEFDRDLRKISPEDYGELEARLRRQATTLLRDLDELDPVRVYQDRIRRDLESYFAEAPPVAAGNGADGAWRQEILGRPFYQELGSVLGERDLLVAGLADFWVEAAEVDRGDPAASELTVHDGHLDRRFTATLGELRGKALARLTERSDDGQQTLRLAALAGLQVDASDPATVRFAAGGTEQQCPAAQFRPLVLETLSRELGLGASA